MPPPIRITDVSPRDGLQNEPGIISAADKVRLVRALLATGVDEIEVSSFVSAKWIPQLGDAAEVFASLRQGRADGSKPAFSALVPNDRGLQSALDVNHHAGFRLIAKVSVFTAASETFAKKNTNATIAETLDRFKPVIAAAHASGLRVRGYLSCVIACPFEGPIAPAAVAEVGRQLLDLGIDELDLGDTIGAGTPTSTRAMLAAVDRVCPITDSASVPLTLHLHDTFGHAAACVVESLAMGVRSFDAAVAGLGGCPYASTPGRRAPGNISTQTLVAAIRQAGFPVPVNDDALTAAAELARQLVTRTPIV